ncbi:MAG TPA: hypothetical protein DCS30_13080 [Rhizobiales bacterium]|nr:hypothetical protein [Cohaesibacter gelatinilyticus]HAT86785.1 hypothetical protein [Hyphomicrobiales bacterium]
MLSTFILSLAALTQPFEVRAGEADVVQVALTRSGDGTYQASVTVEHADEGWDHYANAWEVVAPDGTVLATRVLAHPHVNEQPFTRSLSGIAIPKNIKKVRFRAKDSVHGYGGKEIVLPVNP